MKSKLHETFRISSWGSPKLINNVCVCACARVHAQCVKTYTLFLWLFCYFFWYICCQFLVILKPFLTENEKTEATDRYRSGTSFWFYSFFSISVRKSYKMAEMCPKMVKIPLFWPLVAKIYNLGIKVIK